MSDMDTDVQRELPRGLQFGDQAARRTHILCSSFWLFVWAFGESCTNAHCSHRSQLMWSQMSATGICGHLDLFG